MRMCIQNKLALLGVSAITIFVLTFMHPDAIGHNIEFSESVLGKAIIAYIVLAGVIPWVYLLETTRKKVSAKQFLMYFLGSWLMAPYFLFKMTRKNA